MKKPEYKTYVSKTILVWFVINRLDTEMPTSKCLVLMSRTAWSNLAKRLVRKNGMDLIGPLFFLFYYFTCLSGSNTSGQHNSL